MAGDTAAVEVRLGEIAGVTRGRAYRSADLESSRTALVTLKSFERGGGYREGGLKAYAGPFHATQRVTPGTLVVALTDVTQAAEVIGRPALIGGGEQSFDVLVASQDVAIIRPLAARCETRYLYYHLLGVNYRNHVVGRATGTTVLHLAAEDVLDYRMELPALPEQRAIAHVLGAIDDKIDLNRRMAATLEEMARALFTSWFVRFDPVRAKMADQPTGLPPHVEALFPDELTDLDGRPLPAGWIYMSLGEFATIRGGTQLLSSCIGDAGEFPVYGANGLMGYTDQPPNVNSAIVFGRVGAHCGNIRYIHGPSYINNNASSISSEVQLEFLYYYLGFQDLAALRRGSAQPFIANSALMGLPILAPPPSLISEFQKIAKADLERQASLERQSRTLSALRDALLPKLVSGELRIPDPEAFLRRAGLDAAA